MTKNILHLKVGLFSIGRQWILWLCVCHCKCKHQPLTQYTISCFSSQHHLPLEISDTVNVNSCNFSIKRFNITGVHFVLWSVLYFALHIYRHDFLVIICFTIINLSVVNCKCHHCMQQSFSTFTTFSFVQMRTTTTYYTKRRNFLNKT